MAWRSTALFDSDDRFALKRAKLHPPNADKGCHGFRSNRGRDMRTQRSWVFRDFSSLFLVKENRRHRETLRVAFSCLKVSLIPRVFAIDERSERAIAKN